MPTVKNAVTKRTESVKKAGNRDQYFSRAVSKALETLEVLQTEQGPMALNEIARRIQLSKTSTFRLLRTLEGAGCLVSGGWGRYALAPGVYSVVSTQSLARLLRVAMPHLRSLSREHRETVSVAALFDNRVEVIGVVESPQPIRMSNVVGNIVPPNASSLGKVIGAFQTEERREKLLRSYGIWRLTEHTIIDRAQLDREFEQVRQQRFATDREETATGGNCFAVPIYGESTEVSAAISMSLPKGRVHGTKHEKEIVSALQATAEQIAAELRSV
ncbi:MAG TPA: IclR family transcriptional regulator [Bryobacteraceae bacterium]|nr:IclR family transcriptional regulator [Bryobacteraceae bacterium]